MTNLIYENAYHRLLNAMKKEIGDEPNIHDGLAISFKKSTPEIQKWILAVSDEVLDAACGSDPDDPSFRIQLNEDEHNTGIMMKVGNKTYLMPPELDSILFDAYLSEF